jgi:flagella basal body P-ring formation protein FlgA
MNLEDMDIDIDTLIEMINSGAIGDIVNVKSADGDVVRITVE